MKGEEERRADMDLSACMREGSNGTLLDIYVQPKSSKNEIAGVHERSLKVRLTAPPVEGEANKECVRFFSKLLGIAKSDIEIVSGHKSRHKTLSVRGIASKALEGLIKTKWIG